MSSLFKHILNGMTLSPEHLREQLARRDEQIDRLTQLLAIAQKNVSMLTERMQAIEDMRHCLLAKGNSYPQYHISHHEKGSPPANRRTAAQNFSNAGG